MGLSPDAQYGRIVLVMNKSVCSDIAGNNFKRALGSRFFVHFGECLYLFFFSVWFSLKELKGRLILNFLGI